MPSTPEDDPAELRRAFRATVNMTAAELTRWLETDDSRSVGWHHDGEAEAVGHQIGRRIVDLLDKPAGKLDDDDLAAMRKVIGYVHRHCAQGPSHDVETSRWRYSLMNWGHDPMKDRA